MTFCSLFLPFSNPYRVKKIILTILISLLIKGVFSQVLPVPDTTKKYSAVRAETAPKIDGVLDDSAWANVLPATDFVMSRPIENSTPTQKTEVWIVYDNTAVYVGAMMYDTSPDSILHELGLRDGVDPNSNSGYTDINADLFRFVIDPYNSRQDAYDFGVHASGVQLDSKFSDFTFDAVWESAAKINDKGWVVEMKIPYSAIRFPKKTIQAWGMQITRYIRRNREFDQWCLVPSGAYNAQLYWGTMHGIERINPPLRLSFTPYVATYVERTPVFDSDDNYSYSNGFSYNFGADVKYGIDERFTLDMTLLPDFGQVQSDNKIKTLGYEEITYDENRPFFKEATELFSKDGLFYSRRIGETPTGFYDVEGQLNDGETIIENPSQAKLLNATKISGRTDGGMGLGYFNSITDNTYAVIEDAGGNTREILTEPLTNYNVLVLDQQIKSTSRVYFINTNVLRSKGYDDANVSGAGYTFANSKNSYATDGSVALSQQFSKTENAGEQTYSDQLGYKYFAGVRKISGRFQAGISRSGISPTFDPLDLGYYITNNRVQNRIYVQFYQFQPTKTFREGNISMSANYNTTYDNPDRTFFEINASSWANLLSYNALFGGGGFTPVSSHDYDPRINGKFVNTVRYWYAYAGVSSDYRKRFAVDLTQNISNFVDSFKSEGFNTDLALRFRVNDKLTLNYSLGFYFDPFNFGFANYEGDNNIYGGRKTYTTVNRIATRYIFKNDMSLNISARHYWFTGRYRRYFLLIDNGDVIDYPNYGGYNDFSYNAVNIDVVFSWRFSPGSNLSIVYKNAIEYDGPFITQDYSKNMKETWNLPQTNSFSIKVLYYLDYLNLKKRK